MLIALNRAAHRLINATESLQTVYYNDYPDDVVQFLSSCRPVLYMRRYAI